MKTCKKELFCQYLTNFFPPDINKKRLIADEKVGLIFLPKNQFQYSSQIGYAFEIATVTEENSSRKLLFIRIDSFDPETRKKTPPDYCIPMAYDGASERERLTWTIGFGGGWSDCREEMILILNSEWSQWLKGLSEGLAFTNEEAESAAFFKFDNRARNAIIEF